MFPCFHPDTWVSSLSGYGSKRCQAGTGSGRVDFSFKPEFFCVPGNYFWPIAKWLTFLTAADLPSASRLSCAASSSTSEPSADSKHARRGSSDGWKTVITWCCFSVFLFLINKYYIYIMFLLAILKRHFSGGVFLFLGSEANPRKGLTFCRRRGKMVYDVRIMIFCLKRAL